MRKHLISTSFNEIPPVREEEEEEEPAAKRPKLLEIRTPPMLPALPLAERHAHERDGVIRFNSEHHKYYVNDVEMRISASGLKGFFLAPFDAEKVAEQMFVRSKCADSMYYTSNGMTRQQIIASWADSADKGNRFHLYAYKYFEKWYVNNLEHSTSVTRKNILFSFGGERDEEAMTEDLKLKLHNLLDFESVIRRDGWYPYRMEWVIHDEAHQLAGSVDAVFYRYNGRTRENEFMVVDWKTVSKSITTKYPSFNTCLFPLEHLPNTKKSAFTIQTNIDAHMLRTVYGLNVIEVNAVCFFPSKITVYRMDTIKTDLIFAMWRQSLEFEERMAKLLGETPEKKDPARKPPEYNSIPVKF